ncbi:MAG: hypothetical protein LBI10_09940 [Deltaproteobacteria bacterium]|nr:hypothetical protein [Deltaproteobacteria bacterium]
MELSSQLAMNKLRLHTLQLPVFAKIKPDYSKSAGLAVLLLIAYSMHTWSFMLDDLYKAARNKYSSNKSFITTIACLTEYLAFSSFKQLFLFIIDRKRSFKDS